jgi:hypothetical protein
MARCTARLIGAALSYFVPNSEHADARGAAGGDHSTSCCTRRGETRHYIQLRRHVCAMQSCNHAIKHFALGGAAEDSASARSGYFRYFRYVSSGSALLQEQRTGSPRGASSKRMRLRQPPPWKTAITRRPLVLDDSCNHADPAAARARTHTQTTLAPNTTAAVACDVLKPVVSPEAALRPRASCLYPPAQRRATGN